MTDMTDDEVLSAYIDGELPAEDAERLTERLAREPALLERLEAMRKADGNVRELYAALDRKPMPKAVLELLDRADLGDDRREAGNRADNVVTMPPRAPRSWFDVPMAMAASVALLAGVLLGGLLGNGDVSPGDPLTIADVVAPGSDLHDLLEDRVSAESIAFSDGASGNVVLTFEDQDGNFCRQFHIEGTSRALDGLACRSGERWRVDTLSYLPATGGGYQAASGGAAAAVRAAVDARIGTANPLDQDAETAIISEGWKKPGE